MKKAHELLAKLSYSSYVPTDEQIESLTEEEITAAIKKIDALKQMHSDNHELWHQLDDLETKVLHQSTKLRAERMKGTANVE
jgi:predicted DNA binding CopG/RHH family protein